MTERKASEASTDEVPEPHSLLRVERPAPVPHVDQQLVVLCYTSPPPQIVGHSIEQIRRQGGRVVLVGPLLAGLGLAADVADEFVQLQQRAAPVYVDKSNPPPKYSRRWASVVTRNLSRRATFKPAKRVLGASTLWWLAAHHNRTALSALDNADVITALDAGAVYTVWRASRRNRTCAAINGIGPTMEHLGLAR